MPEHSVPLFTFVNKGLSVIPTAIKLSKKWSYIYNNSIFITF
jgi:hypothetical protein